MSFERNRKTVDVWYYSPKKERTIETSKHKMSNQLNSYPNLVKIIPIIINGIVNESGQKI